MAIQRARTCFHCNKEFTTTQYNAKYCSTSCKSKTETVRKSTTAEKRIARIHTSDAWRWIARECRRAGTVEVLQGVDLVELFSLYNRRYKCYGYDAKKKTSKFHLCHIHPVKGADSIGLLHHANLFIGTSLANQKFTNKHYTNAGLSIKRSSLKKKWLVADKTTEAQIFTKIKSYLGEKLAEYAKHNKIDRATRLTLALRVSKHESNTLSLEQLEKLSTASLRDLEADLKGKLVYQMDLKAKRSLVVYKQELDRFALRSDGASKEGYQFVSSVCVVLAQALVDSRHGNGLDSITATYDRCYLEYSPLAIKQGADISKLRDFVTFTAFETLSGAKVNKELISSTLNKYLYLTDNHVYGVWEQSEYEWIIREHETFKSTLLNVEDSIVATGLHDPYSELLDPYSELLDPFFTPKNLSNNRVRTPAIEYAIYH